MHVKVDVFFFWRIATEIESKSGRMQTGRDETLLWNAQKIKTEERTRLQPSLHFVAPVSGALIDSRRHPIGPQIIGLEEKNDYRLNKRDYKQTE